MIFEPGLRHLLEERERRRHEVQIPGSAAPPFGIDLDAGVAYVDVPPAATPPPTPQARTGASSSSSSGGSTVRSAE